MSQRYVRDLIRRWARTNFACPFYDTINRVPSPPQPHWTTWATVEFDPTGDQLTDFCGGRLSSGLADFIFAAPPTIGDSEILDIAETSMSRLMRFVDPTGALTLTMAHAPEELTRGTADYNYRLLVGVEYRYSWIQPLNPPLFLYPQP